MPATFILDEPRPFVTRLTLSHPTRRNAIDDAALTTLSTALSSPPSPPRTWLIRGEGDTFCAGFDLTALAQTTAALPDALLDTTLGQLDKTPAPTIAVIRGSAIGAGCELALACDFRLAGTSAVFSMPPAKLGIVYSLGGLERITAKVGPQVARRLILTGQRVPAEQALAWGMVDEVVDDDALEARSLEWAEALAANAPRATAGLKWGLVLARGAASPSDREAYDALRVTSFSSAEAIEGRTAMLEKRRPRF